MNSQYCHLWLVVDLWPLFVITCSTNGFEECVPNSILFNKNSHPVWSVFYRVALPCNCTQVNSSSSYPSDTEKLALKAIKDSHCIPWRMGLHLVLKILFDYCEQSIKLVSYPSIIPYPLYF